MRRRTKIILWILASIVIILVAVNVYLFQLGGLESIINREIRAALGQKYFVQVEIGEVNGNLFSGVELEDVVIDYSDSLTSYRLASIRRVSAEYSWRNLMDARYHLNHLHLDSADVRLVRDSARGWLLPHKTSDDQQSATAPPFSVGVLELRDGTFSIDHGGKSLVFSELQLNLALQGDAETYSVDLDNLHYRCSDPRLNLSTAGGQITYAHGLMMFTDLTLLSAVTRMRLDGALMLGDHAMGQLDFAVDNIDLGTITDFVGPKLRGVLDLNGSASFEGATFEGKVDIGGDFQFASFENLFVDFRFENYKLIIDTLYGAILGSCAIDGNAMIDFTDRPEQYRLVADIRNFNLKELVPKSFYSDLNGQLIMHGESFRSETLRLNVSTDIYESSFDDFPIHSAAGDIVITVDSIYFADSFRVDYYENVFTATGAVSYRDSMYLEVQADLANLDRYRGKLFIDQPGGRGKATAVVSGKTSDPDLRGQFVSDSLWLYGLHADSFMAQGDVARFLSGKQGAVEVWCYEGGAWSLPFDSLGARLTLDSNLVVIDSLGLTNMRSFIQGEAVLDYAASPMRLTIDSLDMTVFDRSFYNQRDLMMTIDSTGFYFEQLNVGNDRVRMMTRGRANFDESLDLVLSVAQVPVAPWLSLFEKELDIGGQVSCEATVQGSLDRPTINLYGGIDSLTYQGMTLGDLRVGLTYAERLLTLDSLRVHANPGEYSASGFLAVDLALTGDSLDRFPDSPMDIHITAEDSRFDLVSMVMPSVEELDGAFTADFRLSGTPDQPRLLGGASLTGGRLKYFDLVDPIYTDYAAVTMRNNQIIIDSVVAYVMDGRKKSYAYLDGAITVKSLEQMHYDLDVSIPEGLPFVYELDDIKGRIRGDMRVLGDSPPLVTGDLELIEMKYRVPFAEVGEGSPIMAALASEHSWDLNLNIEMLSNYWIQNEDIDAEFAGNINLIRTAGKYRFIGEMQAMRGKGFLFDKTFHLDPASRVIYEGDLNARLDIVGHSRFTGFGRGSLDAEDNSPEQLDVWIRVTGTIDFPEINPCNTEPCQNSYDITREEMLPLIITNSFSSSEVTASSRFEQGISGVIGSQISQIGTRRLGVETFEIDPFYGSEFDPLNARVTIGFYTAPNLYLYGRSALSLQTGQEVGFEYRIDRHFLIEGRGDEDLFYNLSVKLNWDF